MESRLRSVCLLTLGALLQRRVSYILYVYFQRVRYYIESKLCSLCVLTEGALFQERVNYVLYMY